MNTSLYVRVIFVTL